jgi:hypothetical protein
MTKLHGSRVLARRSAPARVLGFAVAVGLPFAACKSAVQPTGYYAGDGNYQGSPPMCLQYRTESRPGTYARSLLVHFNNTCRQTMDCNVYNDVNDQEQRVVLVPRGRQALLVATGSDVRRFDVELDCVWQD